MASWMMRGDSSPPLAPTNSGPSAAIDYLLPAMFDAALKNFPSVGPNPQQVTTQISKRS